VCTTLGMVTQEQAAELREAGLTAYNHNLDTSPEFYEKITTSRKYEDRLQVCTDAEFLCTGMHVPAAKNNACFSHTSAVLLPRHADN
jgi:biotin synthase-like enzyme